MNVGGETGEEKKQEISADERGREGREQEEEGEIMKVVWGKGNIMRSGGKKSNEGMGEEK